MDRRQYLRLGALGAGASLAGCSSLLDAAESRDEEAVTATGEKIDDWQYDPDERGGHSVTVGNVSVNGTNATYTGNVQLATTTSADAGGSANLGLTTGGASNIADFRRNVEEGYLPLPESLAYEGLFYNYYFDTGAGGDCQSLFCPSYSTAVTADPLSGETERYMTVGLNSNLDTERFERKDLNLVVVLDISGSMGTQFDQYYYDRFGNRHEVEGEDSRSKLQVAKDALTTLTEQLEPGDRFGVVLFNGSATIAKPLRRVGETDMNAIRDHIQEDIGAGGGTNIADGMAEAEAMLGEYSGADQTTTENRQVVITDAMPNLGQTDDEALQNRLAGYAEETIHTSFVGVGVDFNPALVDQITAVEGANYRSVHSADRFEEYVGAEFEYMVTPLVYDLTVEVDAEGFDVATVYGSSAAEESTDELMQVNTLFPSPQSEGRTKGGVVLVQLDRRQTEGELQLHASWEDRAGETGETTTTVEFPAEEPEHFDNGGIRKAVLLARYGDLVKNWLIHERDPEVFTPDDGIRVPPEDAPLGEWEQQSQPLSVSEPYVARIRNFREHFRTEMSAIGDEALQRELDTMDRILSAADRG